MLASFYFGYFIGQIPCGILADTTSPKATYLIGVLLSSALAGLTPLIINGTPWYVLCICRILQGIVQVCKSIVIINCQMYLYKLK